MDKRILAQSEPQAPATVVEIDLVCDGGIIFYNRREGDRLVITARPTSRKRARQIYQENADEPQQRTIGTVDFGPESGNWSWTVQVVGL